MYAYAFLLPEIRRKIIKLKIPTKFFKNGRNLMETGPMVNWTVPVAKW